LALNPAHDFRPAMIWNDYQWGVLLDDGIMFDAEWRGDPGYPITEPGFPVDLGATPRSAPAVVDVNGDGDLEIVFGDSAGKIQIYQNDGTPLPGWPVDIGEGLSESPVAVGDLRGNGEMSIVAGSNSGLVYCYDAQGQMAEGDWPYGDSGANPAFLAIGAFGKGPYPRGIAVGVGVDGYYLDYAGRIFPGTVSHRFARLATHAPAIGDVNGDGIPEAVYATEEVILAASIFEREPVFGRYLPAILSGSPTLGDFDLNGDMEIVVPLINGILYVIDQDGSDLPGFPFTSYTGTKLSTAAIGHMLGTSEPEIVTAARNYVVHLLWYDGVEGVGFPTGTGGWANYGSPIIGRVQGSSSDVVMGSRGQQAWAWDNFGRVIPGWPMSADDNFYEASAMGDIDLDGSNELVLLSNGQLIVVDVNETPNDPTRTWGMAGHDPQRTGCSDCPEDLVTPVEDDVDAITRVSFAAPWPNPSNGSATFRFAVPGPAVVNLEVFDVRGHRVSLVTRKEVNMGHHVASWGGMTDGGAPAASGIYFARLRVQGPGINEVLTRKVTLAR
ncbi:MAG: VCBS repeat-containing protein, partial [Candidatus Krumholzibacteria bacterium]|nr:VCBS repeat-containing protein [Candidatus Krumholzibacteria bacterium]